MEHKEPNIVLDKTLLEDLLKQELHCRKCSKKGLVCMVVKGSHNECSVSVTCPSPDCFYHYELKLETSHHHPHVKTKAADILTQLSVAGHLACLSPRQFQVFGWLSGLPFYGKTQHQRIVEFLSELILQEVDKEIETNRKDIKASYGNSVAIVTDVQWQKPRHNNSSQAHSIFMHKETNRILHYLIINSKFSLPPMQPEPDPKSLNINERYMKRKGNVIEGYYSSSPAMEPDLMYYAARDMKVPLFII